MGQATAIAHNYLSKYKITAILTLMDEERYYRLKLHEKIEHINIPAYKWVQIKDSIDSDISA